MRCENVFCIYQNKGECTIQRININSFGMCTECIHPDIDGDILLQAKIKLLEEYSENPK